MHNLDNILKNELFLYYIHIFCLILDQYNIDAINFRACHKHLLCGILELDLNFLGFDINWPLNCGDILI